MTAQPTVFRSLNFGQRLYALWKFSRPHTIIGTTCSTLSLFWLSDSQELSLFLWAWIACLCGNVYIVGLNQFTDVAIDRVNKPHLPLASGEFSRRQGLSIVSFTGLAAIAIALFSLSQGPWLLATVAISLAIGTAYSLPPFRLKRFPFWASVCIFTVRGVIVNLGLFWHFAGRLTLPPSLMALTAFVLLFTFAIAIFKDIPDMEGDRKYNISTFTLRLGARRIFNLARWVITACYGGLAIAACTVLPTARLPLMLLIQSIALGLFWLLSQHVNLQQRRSITLFYQFIWILFFAQYLLYPLAF